MGGLKSLEWRILHGVLLLASLPLDSNNILMADQPPIIARWSSFSVCQMTFFKSAVFHDIMTKVHESQKKHANLLHLELSPENKKFVQLEIGDRILPCIQSQTRLCMEVIESQRRSEAELYEIKGMLLKLFKNEGLSEDDENHQNRVESYSSQFDSDPNSRVVPALDTASAPIPHNPILCKDGLPRERKPHRRLVGGPFSQENITAQDYWNEYYHGINGELPLSQKESMYGCKWRSDTAWNTKGTSLKAKWSLQKPLYVFMDYLISDGQSPETAVATIQLIFDQQSYKSGKPDIGLCNKVFRMIMNNEVPSDHVGERRQPRKSQKRKAVV
jgi:hypothetical protein